MSMWWFTLIVPGLLLVQNLRQPRLGVKDGRLAALGPKPNAVSTQSVDQRKRVATIDCSKVASPVTTAAQVLKQMSGANLVEESEDYLYAVFKTPLMRFRDDVEVYFDRSACCLHFRSASRAGYSDLGVNRKRYQQFVTRFEQAATA